MQELNWTDLRHVLALARSGTLAAAARRLHVDETTVARRLAAAERALGARIFLRSGGAVRSTASGEIVIAHAERVEREIEAMRNRVSNTDSSVAGSVRLTSVPIVVNRVLVPALPRLLERHPDLRLELIAEPQSLNLTKREADMALRLARPRAGGSTLARRIGSLDYSVYGPAGRKDRDLAWITYEDGMADLPQARWIAGQARRGKLARLAVNDAEAILQAVGAGLGKSLLPCLIGESAGLQRLGRKAPVLSRELWLLVHPDLRPLPRVAAVVDWVTATIAALETEIALP